MMALPRNKPLKFYPSPEEAEAFKRACEARGVSMNRVLTYMVHIINVRVDKTRPKSLDAVLRELSRRPQRRETLRKAHETSEQLKRRVSGSSNALQSDDVRPESISADALKDVDFLE